MSVSVATLSVFNILIRLKVGLAVLCWAVALPLLLIPSAPEALIEAALLLFLCVLVLSLLRVRLQSAVILTALLVIGAVILPDWPDWEHLRHTGSFVLIFACLMPTLGLMRATAMTMPSVWRTQDRLEALSPAHSASGLQLASHVLGAIVNIGAFAFVAASLPQRADERRRLVAAEAALRGMNAAVLWSPFFIAFAVAGVYLPPGFAAGAIGLGLINALLFFIVTSALAAPSGARFALLQSLAPLGPVATRLCLAVGCVVVMSLLTGLTALYAIVTTMPLLCLVQMWRRPDTAARILQNFLNMQKNSGEELLIISVSMFIASLAGAAASITALLSGIFGESPQIWVMIWSLPVIVWAGSLGGVHPVISSAPLLAFFAPALNVYDAVFVAQAHMIGWSTGTMTSFSSLSVVTVAEQFRLRTPSLCFGHNLLASGGLAVLGGGFCAFLHEYLPLIFTAG